MIMFYAYKRYARHLPIYVFLKETYMSRVPISPSCTTNYVGTLPNRKSHNYDGIRHRASQMSPLFVVGSHGPSHGYVITNAFRNDDFMVAS